MDPGARQTHETVSIRGLDVTYRSGWFGRTRVRAVRDLDLHVRAGEVVGVVGPNGSGKSTLLRCLVGLELPAAGVVRVLGAAPGDRSVLRRIGYVAEGRLPLGRLTARELLTLSGTLAGRPLGAARARADDLLERAGLAAAAGRAHGGFSTGMERRLAFAQALYHEPDLLVLDEPTAGMDPLATETACRAIREHAAAGGTAVVATHGLEDFGDDGFDRLVVLLDGRAVATGPPGDVLGVAGTHDLRVAGIDDEAFDRVVDAARRRGARIERATRARRTLGQMLRARQGGDRAG